MKLSRVSILVLVAAVTGGCHHIRHVRDIRAAGDGKLEIEKCDYYINGFWGSGGYQDCHTETITVK